MARTQLTPSWKYAISGVLDAMLYTIESMAGGFVQRPQPCLASWHDPQWLGPGAIRGRWMDAPGFRSECFAPNVG